MRQNRLPLPEIDTSDRLPVPRNVAGHLQRLILRGGLKPGDRLPSQRELAGQLGVSRPSLREAVSVLETMGLVSVKVGSGVYIAAPDARAPLWRFSDRCSPRDVYEARFGLEGYAAHLAATHIDEAGAARLKVHVEEMRAALGADDILGMASADAAFHDLVFELSANPVLAGMYRPVRDMMVETQRLPMTRRTGLANTLAEHEAVYQTLLAGDGPAAEQAMKTHIRLAAQRFGITL
jgi:GntR family transcriptional regulator, transcriptional repressor for pyruvate dehydrogenase complex